MSELRPQGGERADVDGTADGDASRAVVSGDRRRGGRWVAPSASALLAQAVEFYLARISDDRLEEQAALLDKDSALRLFERVRGGVPQGWERLHGAR